MHDETESFISSGIFGRQTLRNRFDVGIRLFESCSRFQTRDESQVVIAAAAFLLVLHFPWKPQHNFARGKKETTRHHAGDGKRLAVERDVAIDDRWIAIEASLPKRIA